MRYAGCLPTDEFHPVVGHQILLKHPDLKKGPAPEEFKMFKPKGAKKSDPGTIKYAESDFFRLQKQSIRKLLDEEGAERSELQEWEDFFENGVCSKVADLAEAKRYKWEEPPVESRQYAEQDSRADAFYQQNQYGTNISRLSNEAQEKVCGHLLVFPCVHVVFRC